MPGEQHRERWLVDRDGLIRVQTVTSLGELGYAVPIELIHGERIYKFVELNDGVEVYEEQE
jgi:hypothetical protein